MKQHSEHPFSSQQRLASQAFETHIPRFYTDEWMTLTTGPIEFGWDQSALQYGFLDPLYQYFDLFPRRWASVLAALLLEAEGYDAAELDYCLAAVELTYLAGTMLREDAGEAKKLAFGDRNLELPMPAHVTLAYTARQFSPILAGLQEKGLSEADRTWLVYRFSRSLSIQEIQLTANLWMQEHRRMEHSTTAFWKHQYATANFQSFHLALDVALAATGLYDTRREIELRGIVDRLSRLYALLQELTEQGLPAALELIDAEMATVRALMDAAPGGMTDALRNFANSVIDPEITRVSKISYAKNV